MTIPSSKEGNKGEGDSLGSSTDSSSVLKVLVSRGSKCQPLKIVLTDTLIKDLKEQKAKSLYPLVYKIMELHLYLSNELVNYYPRLAEIKNLKQLGERLVGFLTATCKEAALFESREEASVAFEKY
mmetsp:Transcript_2587/g.4009  ORF Transcript_2587/g.4009 Transcript_2587/m.4009 type:complete len:126 (+) Transcript_2587:132-509(+)